MKKRFVSIGVIVLVLVLALFALSACNDGRTAFDTELSVNGDFSGYESTDDGVLLDGWTIGGVWDEDIDSPYRRQSVASDSDLYEKHGNGYVILTTGGEDGWVYLSQGIEVDRKAVYHVSVDVRVTSLSGVSDSLVESARDAGASSRQIFTALLLPLTFKDIMITGTFIFMSQIGAFTIPYLVGPNNPKMLGVALFQQQSSYADYPKAMALSVIMFLLCSVGAVLYIWTSLKDPEWAEK